MAILKSSNTLRRERELATENALRLARLRIARKYQTYYDYDAHVQAYRDHLVATYKDPIKTFEAGREIKARWPGDRDYRSFAPKGIVLKSASVKGEFKRFAVN